MNADERHEHYAKLAMSAEDLKHEIELYLRANFPDGWWASVQFDTGNPLVLPETLVVTVRPESPPLAAAFRAQQSRSS